MTTCPAWRIKYSSSRNSRCCRSIAWPARDAVERQIEDPQHCLRAPFVRPTRKTFLPGQHLGKGVRLRQVIVTAGAKPRHPVGGIRNGAQHQDGRGDPLFTKPPHQGNAVQARQTAVPAEDVVDALESPREAGLALPRAIHDMAVFRQAAERRLPR